MVSSPLRNEKGTGAEFCPAVVSGIVAWDLPVRGGQLFSVIVHFPHPPPPHPSLSLRSLLLVFKWRMQTVSDNKSPVKERDTIFRSFKFLYPAYAFMSTKTEGQNHRRLIGIFAVCIYASHLMYM